MREIILTYINIFLDYICTEQKNIIGQLYDYVV